MTDTLRILDAFCGAGGCTKGYQRAGAYVVGVDLHPQPNYCGDEFVQMDALEAREAIPPAYTQLIGEQLAAHLALARLKAPA